MSNKSLTTFAVTYGPRRTRPQLPFSRRGLRRSASYCRRCKKTSAATFIRGIVLECFANELHQIRFKTNALAPAIGCVPKIDDGDPGTIITEIVNELRSKAIDEFTASGRDGAIRILDNIDIEGVGLDGLVAALRGLEVIRLQ